MPWSSFVAGVATAILVLDVANSVPTSDISEVETIPLDEVWGWQMPGTRDIGELESNKAPTNADDPLVGNIRRSLAVVPEVGKSARSGFAVLGAPSQALREANAVITGKHKSLKTLPANVDVSIVFFSYQFGPYVHVRNVTRRGNVVDIQYVFVPHEEQISAEGIALIPLGKLDPGKYRVNISQIPMEQKYLDLGFRPVRETEARRIVCRSFSFAVTEQGD